MTRPNSTGYKGVHRKGNRYSAIGYIDRKAVYLGYYDSAEEAYNVYLKWADQNKSEPTTRRLSDYYKNDSLPADKVKIVEDVFLRMRSHAAF